MSYIPPLYNPYGQPQPFSWSQPAQPINGLVRVDGEEGARMYMLPPNSVSPPLFLSEENAFFVKTTDGGGASTLKKYTFEEVPEEPVQPNVDYVTKDYLDSWAAKMMEAINGKRPLPEQPEE